MNQGKKLVFLFVFLSSLFMIIVSTLAGDFTWYALSSFILLTAVIFSFIKFSDKSLILLLIAIFLCLRYIPIVKFNQPLYFDSVFDLETAEEFEKNAHVGIIGQGVSIDALKETSTYTMRTYSGWPLIHVTAIAIHCVTGLSLFDVFTYFPPLVALSSLLFVYLLANHIFNNRRIGALSALMFATFSITMRWQIFMVRQNIAYTLALMAIYLYIKGQTNKNTKTIALSLLAFSVLPIAHHLTSMEILYVLGFTVLLTWLLRLNAWKKITSKIFTSNIWTKTDTKNPSKVPFEISTPYLFPLTLCFFVGASLFLYWTTYASEIVLQMFVGRLYTIIVSIVDILSGRPPPAKWKWTLAGDGSVSGYLPSYIRQIGNIDLFDILSFTRLFFLVAATLYGMFLLAKDKSRYRPLLYGLFLAPAVLLFLNVFVQAEVTDRHALFLLIPMFLLTAKTIHKFNEKILAMCLLIILLPAPFMLDKTLVAPTYIYDKTSPYDFPLFDVVRYRNDHVLAAASFFAAHTSDNLKADFYTGSALVFFYDAEKVYSLYSSEEYVFLMHKKYLDSHDLAYFPSDSEVFVLINKLPNIASCLYSNGEVNGWKETPGWRGEGV